MTSLPPNGARRDSWIAQIFTGPALVTILVALIGQAGFSVVYQIVNNEQQNAAIQANANEIKALRSAVFDMQTPLATRFFKLEDKVTDQLQYQSHLHIEINRRFDQMDTIGTRALATVANNQMRIIGQVERLAERMILTDKRIGDVDVTPSLIKLQNQIDILNMNHKRLEDAIRDLQQREKR